MPVDATMPDPVPPMPDAPYESRYTTAEILGQYRRNLIEQGISGDLLGKIILDAACRVNENGIRFSGDPKDAVKHH